MNRNDPAAILETAPMSSVLASGPGAAQLPLLLLSAALDDPHIGLLIFNAQLELLHVTSQIPRILALKANQSIAGLSVDQMLSRSSFDKASIEGAMSRIAEFTGDALEIPFLLSSHDQSRKVRMKLRNLSEDYRAASFETLSPDEEARIRFQEFTLRDSLTGIASRAYFEQAVTEALSRDDAPPIAVLLLDLDRFKAVNDTLGHAAGDALLRRASERLKSLFRTTDVVARLGGDEFAILLQPAPSADEIGKIANRILDLVQRTYLIEGQLVNVGTSIGVARSPVNGTDCTSLLRSADLALYQSKASGRACFHFFEDRMAHEAQARRTSELELRRALALRQLEVFYQPQVNTVTNSLVGFEALLRWRHPKRGLIPPSEFLPIAEQIGVISPMGEWVLRTACREARNWPDHVVIAVNASPLQFDSGNYAESVRRALHGTGLPGERLEIEITEGTLLRNDGAVMKTLQDLRSMNVRIAMDDFGTGYASLSQLARFPFDKIKIDRSLAGFEGHNGKQRAIVRAITALGHSLGVATLAEGVEDADQLARLQSDGCTSVQGYFFSRPVPADQLDAIISRYCPPTEES
jgi:diguanylate cyclase (GGDEF)-like protein